VGESAHKELHYYKLRHVADGGVPRHLSHAEEPSHRARHGK